MTANSKPSAQATAPANPAADGAFKTVNVDGLPFVHCTVAELASHICGRAGTAEGGWVVTPNIDILRRWRRDAGFRELVSGASHFTPDGAPIVWASRLQGTPLPGRLTGSDLFMDLAPRATLAGLRVAMIGGNPGAADAAVQRLAHDAGLLPALVRTHCPPFGFEKMPEAIQAMQTLLHDWQPQVVFVGLGSPKQEQLIAALRPLAPQAWYLGVGVSFSFAAGEVRRAPAWAQRHGLEWLHRLAQEPMRLAKRYLMDGLPFALGLCLRSVGRRTSLYPKS